jgi:hypothetical protein
LIDRQTLGLNSKNPDLFLDKICRDMVWPWPPTPPTQFGGILCWGDFKETGGGNISKRFLTTTI